VKRVRSAKKSLIKYFLILLLITLLCLVSYGVYSVWMYEQQLIFSNQAALDVYSNSLIYELQDLTSFNQEIYSSDTDFRLLANKADTLSDDQKILPEYNLRKLMNNRVPNAGAIFLFNKSRSEFFYCFGPHFVGGIFNPQLMQYMSQICEKWLDGNQRDMMQWTAFSDADTVLMMNAYRLNDLYICSILDLNAFISSHTEGVDAIKYAFFTQDQILTNRAYAEKQGITLEMIRSADANLVRNVYIGNIIQSDYYPAFGIGLSGIMSLQGIWSYSRISVILFMIVSIVVIGLFLVIYAFISRILIYPLDQITNASRQLSGAADTVKTDQENLLEFSTIRVALDRLVEQKVQLEQDNRYKTQETEHALLQYYQLQTRSHFFLNCLKSLYHMSERGEIEKIRLMILAFSNHLRYVFHDNLLLVTLKSELDEAQDYYQIIQMDRAHPLLLDLEVDPSLLDCRVPPLVVQTFLENSYKYNTNSKKFLRFSVQIDRIEMEERPYIRLRLSDNGAGYSNEVLKKLSEPDEQFEQYHIGISNLKRRMALIYQNDFQVAFFNAPNGGACSLIYLPMQTEERRESDERTDR
jgi:sensor histidine kinase YesM